MATPKKMLPQKIDQKIGYPKNFGVLYCEGVYYWILEKWRTLFCTGLLMRFKHYWVDEFHAKTCRDRELIAWWLLMFLRGVQWNLWDCTQLWRWNNVAKLLLPLQQWTHEFQIDVSIVSLLQAGATQTYPNCWYGRIRWQGIEIQEQTWIFFLCWIFQTQRWTKSDSQCPEFQH